MNIAIRNSSEKLLYEQIKDEIKREILIGNIKEGDKLPSIRKLSKELRISVITTKRAYDELEEEGFINTAPGKGSFVAPKDSELMKEEYLKKMEEYLRLAIRYKNLVDIDKKDFIEIISILEDE